MAEFSENVRANKCWCKCCERLINFFRMELLKATTKKIIILYFYFIERLFLLNAWFNQWSKIKTPSNIQKTLHYVHLVAEAFIRHEINLIFSLKIIIAILLLSWYQSISIFWRYFNVYLLDPSSATFQLWNEMLMQSEL